MPMLLFSKAALLHLSVVGGFRDDVCIVTLVRNLNARNMGSTDPSPTGKGADLKLPIAGLGGRSYAFLLDWHIRVVAGFAWYAATTLILKRDFIPAELDSTFWWGILFPSLAFYLLYHAVFEILTGGTPGKRLAGVRIVDRNGGTPPVRALLVRNVLRPIDSFVFYAVGLASVLFTRQAVRLGDLAAGTLLVYANGPGTRHDGLRRADSSGLDGDL